MKKRLLLLLPALLLSLTACDISSLINNIGNDDDESEDVGDNSNGNGGGKSQDAGYDDSVFDKPESLQKLMAYGKNTGFEIKTKATESDGSGASEITLGMKGDIWWMIDDTGYGTGYRLENNVCSMLTYDETAGSWSVLIANAGETQYTEMFDSITSYLYTANDVFANEGFVADGTSKYAGRDVLKFKYSRTVATYSAKHDYYVDKDLGITLYEYAESTSDGETDWVKFETTSFKSGNDVTAITVA